MNKIVIGILFTFLLGCSAPLSYDLSQVPSYSQVAVDKKYEELVMPLVQMEQELQQIVVLVAMLGESPTEDEKVVIQKQYDVFLFYKAATDILIFYGDYEEASSSSLKAMAAMNEIYAIALAILDQVGKTGV